MADVNISAAENISSVQVVVQGSDPATPDTGFARVYAKADGLYIELDDSTVIGPFIDTGGGGGDVSGPGSSTSGDIATWNGAGGDTLADSGKSFDTDGTLAANSDSKIPTQKAVKTYADQLIAAADAMVFKGVIDCSANPNYPAADRGATYRVSVAGKIGGGSGVNVEAGDLLICLTDSTSSGTQAGVGSAWTIAQTNLDGAMIGPASSTNNNIATFNGTTGKTIQDGGKGLPSGAIVGTSDSQTLTNKTLTTPTIGDLSNAGHNHSNAAGGGGSLSPATLILPNTASPAETAEGSAVWDSDDDVLTIGDGSSRKTFGYLGTSTPQSPGVAAAGTSKEVARADHVHSSSGDSGDAVDIAYDNGSSGLSATDVQAAIDELAGEVGGGGGSALTNVALNKTYSVSPSPNASYPDTGKLFRATDAANFAIAKPLTDGIRDEFSNVQTSAWYGSGYLVGWSSNNDPIITLDLGAAHSITMMRVWGFQKTGETVYLPSACLLEYSDDNSSWSTQTNKTGLSGSTDTWNSWLIEFSFAASNHRYWRVTLTHGGAFTFVSEVELYA